MTQAHAAIRQINRRPHREPGGTGAPVESDCLVEQLRRSGASTRGSASIASRASANAASSQSLAGPPGRPAGRSRLRRDRRPSEGRRATAGERTRPRPKCQRRSRGRSSLVGRVDRDASRPGSLPRGRFRRGPGCAARGSDARSRPGRAGRRRVGPLPAEADRFLEQALVQNQVLAYHAHDSSASCASPSSGHSPESPDAGGLPSAPAKLPSRGKLGASSAGAPSQPAAIIATSARRPPLPGRSIVRPGRWWLWPFAR